jgi:CBS domain-containing protein
MNAIESLMKTELIDAEVGETVAGVANRMAENQVGVLLVRDGDTLRGVFSERDLLKRVVGEGRDPYATNVETVMTTDIVTADVTTPIKEVLQIFREHRIRHIPVVRDGKPVGILSTRDFLGFLVEGLERFIEEAMYSEEILEGSDPYDHIGGSYGR